VRFILAVVALLLATPVVAEALTVCADPNNMPFSNQAGEGFENKLVSLLAKDLHAQIEYVWWAQRRGFARNTLAQSRCDLWPGVASGIGTMSTSRPYYRSTYVFLTRVDRNLKGLTLDDPRLRALTIGVQLIGYDGINTPPAQALADRGLTGSVRGFMLFGDYGRPNPPAAIVNAVADGSIDVALVWGPLAGYFARHEATALQLEPIANDAAWGMTYDVSVGVRRDANNLRDRIDAALAAERPAIGRLLANYGVPVLADPSIPANAVTGPYSGTR
jgi:mxaJ protein